MWLLFGISAITFTVLNLTFCLRRKDSKWFRFGSLSFTSLTVCAFYSEAAESVLHEDWAGLIDIMSPMSRWLWICVIISILVNGVSLFYYRKY